MNPSISNNRVRDSVKTINGNAPDVNGEVTLVVGQVSTVNAITPDISGNVNLTPADIGGVGKITSNASILQSNTIDPYYGNNVGLSVRISSNAGNALSLTPTGMYVPVNNLLLKYNKTIVATAGVQYQIPHSFSTPHVFVQAYDWGSIIEGVLVQPSNVKIDVSNVFITFATSSTFIVNILGFNP